MHCLNPMSTEDASQAPLGCSGGGHSLRATLRLGVRALFLFLVAFTLGLPRHAAAQLAQDDFEELAGWSTDASEGTSVEIARDTGHTGMGMRIDFDFHTSGGFVIVRKAFPITLPANYAFRFFLRGEAPTNNFEFKLVDRTGKNVWWYVKRAFSFPSEWQAVTIKKSRIEFAWGPAGGAAAKQIGTIELAISAATGGKGSVWIDDFRLDERQPPARREPVPKVTASTAVAGHEPEHMMDRDPQTEWRSGTLAPSQWVLIDFLKTREYGGLVIDWDGDDYATAYQVEVSDDGESWTPSYHCATGNGGRDYIYMPDAESRYLRLDLEQSSRGQGYAIHTLTLEPFEFSASPNQFFTAMAQDAPTGTYPKYFSGRQTYWTLIGVNGDDKEAALNEEGMLEVEKGAFSIEPFVYADGALLTWDAVHTTQTLEQGYLPIPSVRWQREWLTLTITAFAGGPLGASTLYARYRLENSGDQPHAADLFLAIRPFQVVPPWQSLNMAGGVSSIHALELESRLARVNGDKALVLLTPPDRFGAASFEEGLVTDFLAAGKLPTRAQVSDPLGYASGALAYRATLAPGATHDVYLAVPFHGGEAALAAANATPEDVASRFAAQLEDAVREWQATLGCVDIVAPPAAAPVIASLKTTLAYILINRNGPALRPGSRNYARSWIRDGASTAAALLSMGLRDEVRHFIRWFAGFQFADGRIPCCVDHRGADPVPENDSNGEFIYTVAEYYRYSRDVGFLNEVWPSVVRATDYLAALRRQRLTEVYARPDKQQFFGLLPESISHEGYASHPVHSYWDDFFALRGLKDAADLAVVLGDDEHAAPYAALRDAFRADLYGSIARVMTDRKLAYVPASADLGDFDPNSTAIAVSPGGELHNLPQPALTQTFDDYYRQIQQRQREDSAWDAYTPYELRNVAALVRMGQRARANEVLGWLLRDQRPAGWNAWQEVVWRDPATPKFIGDMPHTWVGSSFIESARSLFAYEREADRALVLGAGLPEAWVLNDTGVSVKRLPTYYGVLSYSMRSDGPNQLRVKLSGDLSVPPGSIIVAPPLPQPLKAATVNGKASANITAESVTVTEFPADVVLEY
jgi:F5/8 type C domain-containing protein